MEADSDGANVLLQLEPFIHQVGGHSSMLQLDENTICKPLIVQELNFYKTSPDSLKCFMPQFKGIIEVTFSIDNNGFLSLTSCIPLTIYESVSNNVDQLSSLEKLDTNGKHKFSVLHRIKVCHAGSIQIEKKLDGTPLKQKYEQIRSGTSCDLHNPWVLHCHEQQVKKIQNASSSIYSQKYILLENLTSNYEFPCILDVKMGTRNYGDDASAAKRQSHIAKTAATTLSTLGIRISGFQVYHQDSGQYKCHNKYYGRGLTIDGFHHALYHYLHDGTKLRQDVIAELLKKLHSLQDVIRSLETFRFFTSSLLIVYDGKLHTNIKEQSNGSNFEKANDKFYKNDNNGIMYNNCSSKSGITNSCMAGSCRNFSNSSSSMTCKDECHSTNGKTSIVDVRMIDFAHSTHSQLPEVNNEHVGSDEGYLFGLGNLISQLKTFQQENNQPSLF